MGIKALTQLFGVTESFCKCSTPSVSLRVPFLSARRQTQRPNFLYKSTSTESDGLPVLSDTSPNHHDGPESQPWQPICVKSIPISLPCGNHTTFNHALNFHAAMHAICPGAPCHHHDAIGGPAVHCASDQHTICKLQCCALRLHPSRCPFIVPSTLAVPQRPLCFVASPFTMGCGGDPMLIFRHLL